MMRTMELDTSLDRLKINKIITVSNSICRNNNFPALISWPVVFATSPVSALLWCLHPGCDLKGAARTFHRSRHSCRTKETSHLVTRLLAQCALTPPPWKFADNAELTDNWPQTPTFLSFVLHNGLWRGWESPSLLDTITLKYLLLQLIELNSSLSFGLFFTSFRIPHFSFCKPLTLQQPKG